ncbi:GxxExxY protein [Gracilimonas amylolytica]|uniref:GxxExxY protein n=1 Tax=Gracilimonas amylolytica TaxID=1749045 RepID=UPI001E29A5A4|nr:GxxExxY protein [Gracilimonas amylolytica]
MILLDELTDKVIGSAIRVHKELGPGLLESAYQECLFYVLRKEGLLVEKEKPIPIKFEDVELDCGYRIDLLVEKRLVLELKAVENLNKVHFAQVLSYLKLGNFPLGLLLNFNVSLMKNGIKRVIN